MLIGSLLLAPLASRVGAKRLAMWCLFAMGALNLTTLFAPDAQTLVVCRIAVGLTLGGVVPPTLALVPELFPARRRSALVAMLYLGTTSGIMMVGVAGWATLSRYGWRGEMAIGGVMPIIVALAVWRVWCESPVWLLARGPEGASRVKGILARLHPHAPASDGLVAEAPCTTRAAGVAQLFVGRRLVGTLAL